jgi:hypothetical protein
MPAEVAQPQDRVEQRRRAAALARHYRDQEGLPIAEVARRLGRAEATIKAYLYDPADANKRLSRERMAKAGGRASGVTCPPRQHKERTRRTFLCGLGCPARPVGLGF